MAQRLVATKDKPLQPYFGTRQKVITGANNYKL